MGGTLLVLSRAPYAGSLARAGIDTALAYAAFEQPLSVLFTGAGVLQLVPAQAPAGIGRRSLRQVIDSLPLYDVETVYADAGALLRYRCDADDLPPFVAVLTAGEAQRALQERHRHVLSF